MTSKPRTRDIPPRSFKKSSWLPGTRGNPFDVILTSGAKIDRMPAILFLLILAALAYLAGKFDLVHSSIFFLFFLVDWLLIALLPKLKRSFGPVKPVVLLLAVLRVPFALLPFWVALGAQLAGTLLVLAGFYIEPMRLDIHAETLKTNKLRTGQTLRLVHLGDLHIERITRREEKILRALEDLKPDLILFSGDILNLSYVHDPLAQQEAHAFLAQLHAPLGVFGVTGSPPVDPLDVYAKLLENTEIQWLDDRNVVIPVGESGISITGLTCTHLPERDFPNYLKLNSENDESRFNILLYHSPDIAPLMRSTAVDLQLSGHTHGGQVRLPFFGALYAASLYGKNFESGRYLLGKMTLYVTRGLGMEGGIAPRVRFLCPPELIVWEIAGTA